MPAASFWVSTVPYVVGIINLLGYPAELDGGERGQAPTLRATIGHLWRTMRQAIGRRSLRRLIIESMGCKKRSSP